MGSFSVWHWAVVLLIIMLVFGTKKLSNIDADLGMAVKGFKDGVKGEDEKPAQGTVLAPAKSVDKSTIDVEAKEKAGN